MINLITGLPGSGKTLYRLGAVDKLAKAENRTVYYHGIPDLTLDWVLMDSPEDWINLPPKSIIVIDECQSTFRPRAASTKPPPYISEFETHRHKGLDFFLLTQHPMLIDGNIRRLAGKHYHVVRFYGFQKSTIHEFQSVRDNVDKNTKNSIETHFIFPKDVFNWYKSADAHTMKRRIPMRMVMLIILPILLIGMIYAAYKTINSLYSQPEQNMLKLQHDKGLINANNSNASLPPEKVQEMNYIESHTPAIAYMPHTAPIYQEITKPISAPYPAACMVSKSKGCQCFTQQATSYPLPQDACLVIVKGGIFIDWQMQTKQPYQPEKFANSQGIIKGETLDAKPAIYQDAVGITSRSSPNAS